ncbi:MAG: hypothetical protein E7665_00715 [Ruminococcaceae bacterium]|nr:hypothetical protein [Oscillospiraceae bacterium]
MSSIPFTTALDTENFYFKEAREEPFDIYGLYKPRETSYYCRMPEEIAVNTNPGVAGLYKNPAGGRIRFRTDSSRIAIHLEASYMYAASHFTKIGSSGIDVYCEVDGKYRFAGTYLNEFKDFGHEGLITFPGEKQIREVMIHMPNYNCVTNLYIGLDEGSLLEHGKKYLSDKPIVYYGSSITQGGCSSRPGNAYTHIISINNNKDFINLGFSGSAKGEEIMANYIAGLEMSAFVMDYDHNAPNPEHLEATHEKFFKIIREKNPALPVVFVSKPDFHTAYYRGVSPVDSIRRRDIIYRTYINAVNSGDKFVKFIDGSSLFNGMNSDACTVDGCHPNDLGFMRMAEVIGLSL